MPQNFHSFTPRCTHRLKLSCALLSCCTALSCVFWNSYVPYYKIQAIITNTPIVQLEIEYRQEENLNLEVTQLVLAPCAESRGAIAEEIKEV